jgi:hypothetical protein
MLWAPISFSYSCLLLVLCRYYVPTKTKGGIIIMMIYIYYFAIGLTTFCIFQFISRGAIMDSREYQTTKALAWVSIPAWPMVGAWVIIVFTTIWFIFFN